MERGILLKNHATRSIWNGWIGLGWGIVALILLPIFSVILLSFSSETEIWKHLSETILFGLIKRSFLLMLGTSIGVILLGVPAAWLVALCRFPCRNLFQWALLLPMAMPAYIFAYVATDQLEYAGNVQIFLRFLFGWESARDYWFPDIRSLGGAIVCMSLTLYPYVYMMARSAFLDQSQSLWHASRILGYSSWQTFFRLSLPLARVSIVIGLIIVIMETLNDFGVASFFAVHTLATGVYEVWFEMNSPSGAAQIALVMFSFVAILIYLEKRSRAKKSYHELSAHSRPAEISIKLSGWKGWLAFAFCLTIITLGFLLPFGILFSYSVQYFDSNWTSEFFEFAWNSFSVSSLTALATLTFALFLVYGVRVTKSKNLALASQFSMMGYALPGTALAVGVLIPMAGLDNFVDGLSRKLFDLPLGLLITGSVGGLVYAYCIRFMALGIGGVESGLMRVKPSLDKASQILGVNARQTLWRVHLPLIRNSIFAAGILIFVDTMKELSTTMVLKPYNFNTLATYVYQYAGDGLLEESALGALAIVICGMIPVIMIYSIDAKRQVP